MDDRTMSAIRLHTLTMIGLAAMLGACSKNDTPVTAPPPPPPTVTEIVVTPHSDSVVVADTVRLTATASTADRVPAPATITWTSSNKSIATVDTTGLVTGVAAGQVTIKAASGLVSDSAVVLVKAAP